MKNGLHCSGGKNWFSVGADGKMYRCNALLYHEEAYPNKSMDGYMGNILTEDVKVGTEFQRCPFQECMQVCDRHWAQKKVYREGVMVDYEDVTEPLVFKGHSNPVTIAWNTTWECNYKCQYCKLPDTRIHKSKSFQDWIRGFSNFIRLNKISGGLVMCSGGEPLFMKGIEHVLYCLYHSGFRLAINTNLSHDIYKEIIRLLCGDKKTWPPKFSFQASLHCSEPQFNWDAFRDRVLHIRDHKVYVAVNIVAHPDHIEKIPFYYNFFESEKIQFKVSPLVGYGIKTLDDYPEDSRKILRKYIDPTVTDDNKFIAGTRYGNIPERF